MVGAKRKIHSQGGKLEAIKHHFVSESMIQFKLRLDNRKKRETTQLLFDFQQMTQK